MIDRHLFRSGRWHPTGAPAGDTTPPVISGVVETPGDTTCTISWNLDQPATGYIEYGTTTAYGLQTTFEPSYLTYHSQVISGLTEGTTYYYRIVSVDASGNGAEYAGDFDTTGSLPAPTSAVFGPAVESRAKGNLEMRPGNHGYIGLRFKALVGGTVNGIRFQATNRVSPYGAGDAGIYRVGIQSLDGAGKPSGTWLGNYGTWDPVITTSPANFGAAVTISGGPTLVAGQSYAVVIQNVHSSPDSNYTSINNIYAPDAGSPLQPLDPDDENVTYYHGPSSWSIVSYYPPCFDVRYTSGAHEGLSAIQGQDWLYNPTVVGIVNSGSIGCWSFTRPSGAASIDVDAVSFWLQKSSGSTNATVTVKKNGSPVATGTFTTSGGIASGARAWCRAALSGTVTIDPGDVIRVEVAVASGEYRLPLILWRDSGTTTATQMDSYPYDEGGGSNIHRADDGASGTTPCWSAWYAHTTYSCYFEVV